MVVLLRFKTVVMGPRITQGTSMVIVGESAITAKIKRFGNEMVARTVQVVNPKPMVLLL